MIDALFAYACTRRGCAVLARSRSLPDMVFCIAPYVRVEHPSIDVIISSGVRRSFRTG